MLDSSAIKLGVLKELMAKMREMEGSKMRPKAVELSVSSMKPEEGATTDGDQELEPKDLLEAKGGLSPSHEEPDADELSPEDAALLEELLGGDKEHEG